MVLILQVGFSCDGRRTKFCVVSFNYLMDSVCIIFPHLKLLWGVFLEEFYNHCCIDDVRGLSCVVVMMCCLPYSDGSYNSFLFFGVWVKVILNNLYSTFKIPFYAIVAGFVSTEMVEIFWFGH